MEEETKEEEMIGMDYYIKLLVYAIVGGIFIYYGWRKVFLKGRKRITQEELDAHEQATKLYTKPLSDLKPLTAYQTGYYLKNKITEETTDLYENIPDLIDKEREIFEWKHSYFQKPHEYPNIDDYYLHRDYQLIKQRSDGSISIINTD